MSRVIHWRRHDEYATAGFGPLEGRDVTASACGRLVHYTEAVGDPGEADCPDCLRAWAWTTLDNHKRLP